MTNKKRSLKLRLISFILLTAIGVWLISGVLSWVKTREQMDEFFDTYQILMARQLSVARWQDLRRDAQTQANKIIKQLINDGEEEDEAIGFAIFDKNGEIVFHDGENGRYFSYVPDYLGFAEQIVDDETWRIIWVKSAHGAYRIAVGQELKFRNETAFEMIIQTLIPWGVGLIILIIVAVFFITRELKPVRNIAKKIAYRKADDLSPITADNLPKEINPLIEAMNRLLQRINKMVERERSFISDAAHELRSPLAALKVQLDVALLSREDATAQNRAFDNIERSIERANRLVDQLLTLSRLEAAGNNYENPFDEDLDWKKILEEIIFETSVNAQSKNMNLRVVKPVKTSIKKGRNFLWSLLLRNLIDNAIKYSPENSDITIEFNEEGLQVTNSNTRVNQDNLDHLGERFFRPSGQKTSGSGLGLSIVKRVAQIHNCEVEFANSDQGFTVKIVNNLTK